MRATMRAARGQRYRTDLYIVVGLEAYPGKHDVAPLQFGRRLEPPRAVRPDNCTRPLLAALLSGADAPDRRAGERTLAAIDIGAGTCCVRTSRRHPRRPGVGSAGVHRAVFEHPDR